MDINVNAVQGNVAATAAGSAGQAASQPATRGTTLFETADQLALSPEGRALAAAQAAATEAADE